MSIAGAEPAQEDAPFIGAIVAVGVFQEEKFGTVSDVNAAVAEFETGGHVEAAGKDFPPQIEGLGGLLLPGVVLKAERSLPGALFPLER